MAPTSRGFFFDLSDQLENNANVHRQLVEKYESEAKRTLIAYHANLGHPGGAMVPPDASVLDNICASIDFALYPEGADLYMHTNGGLPEVSARMLRSLRARAKTVRLVVPNQALSAGTLLALGCDSIVLGPASCLGPIDPQMIRQGQGGPIQRPAKVYIDAYEQLLRDAQEAIRTGQPPQPLLQQLQLQDESFVQECRQARKSTEKLAGEFLKSSMMKDKTESEIGAAVKKLIEHGDQGTHGTPIFAEQARSIGLKVEEVADADPLGKILRELFARVDVYVTGRGVAKNFLCRSGGIDMNVRVQTK
jgi:hypothetical protein